MYWRESRHFSPLAYMVGKNLASLPYTCFYPLVVLTFWYQLLEPAASFVAYYVSLVLLQWAAEGHGQLASLLFSGNQQLAGGVVALVSVLLTGSIPNLDELPTFFTYVSYGNFGRWFMQMLMALEYYPWLYAMPGFPPPLDSGNASAPDDPSCLWQPGGCAGGAGSGPAVLVDGLLAQLNSTLAEYNCTEAQGALANTTRHIDALLQKPWDAWLRYEQEQALHKTGASPKNCECYCGYTGISGVSCDKTWYPYVPYCRSEEPFDPHGPGNQTWPSGDAISVCVLLGQNGYTLPSGPSPLYSVAARDSMILLAALGLAARVLVYLALLCIDRKKR